MIQNFKEHCPVVDSSCYLAPGSAVIGRVQIGKNSSVWHHAVLRGDVDRITIGENSNVQDGCMVHCVTGKETIIGNHVTVGHGAILHSCIIEDDSLIGMGAIVLDGARVGKNCLVGAGAVVTPNTIVPEGSLVVGSPAKVKRELTGKEMEHIRSNALEYITLSKEYLEMVKEE